MPVGVHSVNRDRQFTMFADNSFGDVGATTVVSQADFAAAPSLPAFNRLASVLGSSTRARRPTVAPASAQPFDDQTPRDLPQSPTRHLSFVDGLRNAPSFSNVSASPKSSTGPRSPSNVAKRVLARGQPSSASFTNNKALSMADLMRIVKRDRAQKTRRRVTMRSAGFAVLMLVRIQRAVQAARDRAARSEAKLGFGSFRRARSRRASSKGGVGDGSASARTSSAKSSPRHADAKQHAPPTAAAFALAVASDATNFAFNDDTDDDGSDSLEGSFPELTPGIDLALAARPTPSSPWRRPKAASAAADAAAPRRLGLLHRRFPPYEDLLGLPPETQAAVSGAAAQVLRRSLNRYCTKLIIAARRRERRRDMLPATETTKAIIAKGAARSPLLAALPSTLLQHIVLQLGVAEVAAPGDCVGYFDEPPSELYFVVDGTVQLSHPATHRSGGRPSKRLTPTHNANGSKAKTVVGPAFIRETRVVVDAALDDDNRAAVHCLSHAHLIRVPAAKFREAVRLFIASGADGAEAAGAMVRQLRAGYIQRHAPLSPSRLRAIALFEQLDESSAVAIVEAFEPFSFLAGATVINRREQFRTGLSGSPLQSGPRRDASGSPPPRQREGTSFDGLPRATTDVGAHGRPPRTFSTIPLVAESRETLLTPLDTPPMKAIRAPAAAGTLPRSSSKGTLEIGFDTLIIVARGTLVGATPYVTDGQKRDLVFAVWRAGDHLGEKAVYFEEPHIFSVHAREDADCFVLRRARLMQLIQSTKAVRHATAAGALAIRRGEPAVALRLESVRAIPWMRAAMRAGVLSECDVKDIFHLFEFRIFPLNELITSSTRRVTELLAIMTGTAIAAFNTGEPAVVPLAKMLGVHGAVLSTRWRYATIAMTECEAWSLGVDKLRAFLLQRIGPKALDALETLCHDKHRTVVAEAKQRHLTGMFGASGRLDGSQRRRMNSIAAAVPTNPNVAIFTDFEELCAKDDPPKMRPADAAAAAKQAISAALEPRGPYGNASEFVRMASSNATVPPPRRGRVTAGGGGDRRARDHIDWNELEAEDEAAFRRKAKAIKAKYGSNVSATAKRTTPDTLQSQLLEAMRAGQPSSFRRRQPLVTVPSILLQLAATPSASFATSSSPLAAGMHLQPTNQSFGGGNSSTMMEASHLSSSGLSARDEPSPSTATVGVMSPWSWTPLGGGSPAKPPRAKLASSPASPGPIDCSLVLSANVRPGGGSGGGLLGYLRNRRLTAGEKKDGFATQSATADPDLEFHMDGTNTVMSPAPVNADELKRRESERYRRMLAPVSAVKLFGTRRVGSAGYARHPSPVVNDDDLQFVTTATGGALRPASACGRGRLAAPSPYYGSRAYVLGTPTVVDGFGSLMAHVRQTEGGAAPSFPTRPASAQLQTTSTATGSVTSKFRPATGSSQRASTPANCRRRTV
jgi:CRP-like cAMP-binding protein